MANTPQTDEETIARIVEQLRVEQVDALRFRGRSDGFPHERVFGGLVLAQASMAAARTVADDRHQHSLHAYFLRGGDPREPIEYAVEVERDGRTFSSRRVEAMQHGEPICAMMFSFARPEEGIEHGDPMPDVPQPEELEPFVWTPPPGVKVEELSPWPFEIRPVTPIDVIAEPGEDPTEIVWVKLRAPLPDDPLIHTAMLVYDSDADSFGATARRHGDFIHTASASLDHAFWLHRPWRWDDWMLAVTRSPAAHSARALSFRYLYSRSNLHVATMAQEGLFRVARND
jgi:acyl-CoA thioesterase-2